MNAALNAEISRLSRTEKLQLVEELWDNLAANPDQLAIPAWHAKLLAEDQALYRANPTEGSGWAEVKSRITDQT